MYHIIYLTTQSIPVFTMTRKKYSPDTYIAWESSEDESSEDEFEDVSYYNEDIAWENLHSLLSESTLPSWLHNYIDADFVLDLILDGKINYYPCEHLYFQWETEDDLDDLRDTIVEMIECTGYNMKTLDDLDRMYTIFCALMDERSKYFSCAAFVGN